MIILLNAFYGFMMVVVHVFIFREPRGVMAAMETIEGKAAVPVAAVVPGSDTVIAHKHNWYLQVVDLDLAWAHGVLGFNDWYLCMLGLSYGVIIIAFSLFVLHAVVTAGRTAAVISRWFMMFLHMELFLYVAVVLIKLPLLCRIKHHFLTLMNEDCTVLRFMFAERALSRIIIGSLCCWVFSSFAYLLAWGDATVDDAPLDDENQRRGVPGGGPGGGFPQYPLSAVAVSPQGASFAPPNQGYAEERRYPQGTRASFDRQSQVGEPVSVNQYEPRWVGGSQRGSFADAGQGAYPGRGSFAAQQGRFGGSQNVMPRASSSIQSNASQAERQMLIKPPIVIH